LSLSAGKNHFLGVPKLLLKSQIILMVRSQDEKALV